MWSSVCDLIKLRADEDQPKPRIRKGNFHKRMTFEDKFSRYYACWVKNNPKAWRWWKVQTRRAFRRKMKHSGDDTDMVSLR